MAELKTKKHAGSVSAFIDAVDHPERRKDAKALLAIMKKATGMKPAMWGTGMVGFGTYHYKSERSTQEGDWPLVAFAPRKSNLTLYLMSGAKRHAALLKKLGKHKISGGSCVYINKLADVDESTLVALIRVSVETMKKRYGVK